MARMGGIFPFPIAQVAEGGTRITLGSGGVFILPANQYLVILDANSVLQYWDPQAGVWQTLYGHSTAGDVTSDGANYRILNDSGTLAPPVLATNNSSGYTNGIGPVATGATVGVPASPTASMTGSAYVIVGGVVGTPTVTQSGSGFTSPPLVVIDPPPVGGIQAVAHANLTAGGGIASITVDQGGAGYVTSPNFWLIPQSAYYTGAPSAGGGIAAAPYPPGGLINPLNALTQNQSNIVGGTAGALITPVALTGTGVIQAVRIVNSGGLYVGAQTLTIVGGGGTIGTTTVTSTPPGAVAVATVVLAPRINQ
jgi:hypothetical protein